MSQPPFPAPGPDGDQPPPGAGARDGADPAGTPAHGPAGDSAGPAGTPAGSPAEDSAAFAETSVNGAPGASADLAGTPAAGPAGDGAGPAGAPANGPARDSAGPAGTPAVGPADVSAGPAGTPAAGPARADAAVAGRPPAAGPDHGSDGDDDFDADADLARFLADVDAGLIPIPPEAPESLAGMPAGPGVWFTLGEAADVDPAELAVMAGPGGLGGQVFAADRAADAMRPGPLLSILAEQAADDRAALTDDELMGLVSAARRLQARAQWLELAAIAEFTGRRQAQHDAAVAGGARPGRRPGEFAAEELGFELVMKASAAGDRMDMATALATRLPCTFAGMAAGMIDGRRAYAIWYYTRFLSDEDAGLADAILAEAAPGLRQDQLEGKAGRLEFKLDPEAVKARREHARREGRRVEARREASGNMSFGARELSVEEALAVKAACDADAAALRAAGMPGSLRELRVLAFLDRQAGRNPLDRVTALNGHAPGDGGTGTGDGSNAAHPATGTGPDPRDHDRRDSGGEPGQPHWDDDEDDEDEDEDGGPGHDGPSGGQVSAPLPALINLIIPAGTLFGWSTAPGDAGGWGLLDTDETRSIVQTASQHPRTRWCVTVTGPDGTAIAHGCARGSHPWTSPPPATTGTSGNPPPHDAPPHGAPPGTGPPATGPPSPGPNPDQAAQLAALLRALKVQFSPIARGGCDHRDREDRYKPSRRLGHLVRARTATCIAPGCGVQAYHADLDHTIPWPVGITCQCDLSPGCRRHHRVKQAPGWHLDQPQPGIMRWTTPSGRTYTTRPTVYDL